MKTLRLVTKANLVAVLALSSLTAFAADSVKVDGWISDSKCGADHAGKGANAACVGKCINGGAKPIFVDDAKNTVWTIDDPDVVKGHYGHHIEATATVDADKKVVHITKVTMLPDQGPKNGGMDMDHQ